MHLDILLLHNKISTTSPILPQLIKFWWTQFFHRHVSGEFEKIIRNPHVHRTVLNASFEGTFASPLKNSGF
jgi:hypothetical protein